MTNVDYGRYTICFVIIAVFVFVFLTISAIKLFGGTASVMRRYPPWLSECPDYWTKVHTRNGTVCQRDPANANGRETCNATPGSYNYTKRPPPSSLYYENGSAVPFSQASLTDRCTWAKACDVYWEGLSEVACTDNADYFDQYSGAIS